MKHGLREVSSENPCHAFSHRQYALESDRFINPGEDFTPEPDFAAATGD